MTRIPPKQCFLRVPPIRLHARSISKYLDKDISAKVIRKRFLDYFIDSHNHNFVKSSPVVPYCDPTVAFVNAGMNQFKGVFLGSQASPYKRVVNSQKCVRVGGKHNDLNIVGKDGYHHTFFEMLGNWSFGDYFKKEACEMSWNLLTKVYRIPKSRLYVTYFGGDKDLGLDADLECRDIWKGIGVPNDRILPFGMKENFWEMGLTGPCGPCTEIHIDRLTTLNRAIYVNKDLPDLTELWNIVFIQYNRETDGKITQLPMKHIDTGMGFERLVAVLQGKISNYDTDVFEKLFCAIHKCSKKVPEYEGKFGELDWNQLDTSYRVLGDHARMITACLADGMIPEQNQKLRRVMRRAFLTSETIFQKEKGLLKEISNYVVECLGPVYQEMERNIKQVHAIIDYEEDIYRELRRSAASDWKKLMKIDEELSQLDVLETPGLITAYKEMKKANIKKITPDVGFKLYDTFGLDEDSISQLAKAMRTQFDLNGFKLELEKAKLRSKEQSISSDGALLKIIKNYGITDDAFKYNYRKVNEKYVFEDLETGILKIIKGSEVVTRIEPACECSLILEKTNFYSEAGGQVSDTGVIEFPDGVFEVRGVRNVDGCILHNGVYESKKEDTGTLSVGSRGVLKYDKEQRLQNMSNHTAIHILNSILKKIKGVTCQKSSKVTPLYLSFDVGIFGGKLSIEDVAKIEEEFSKFIQANLEVEVKLIDSQKLFEIDHLTLIPGEVYPQNGIRLIKIDNYDIFSREPCCGTHVMNTKDIEDFCIISLKSLGRSTASLHAVTGEKARIAKKNGRELLEDVAKLRKNISDNIDSPGVLENAIKTLEKKLKFNMEDDVVVPYVVKQECQRSLTEISREIKDTAKNQLKEFIEMEMANIIETKIEKTPSDKRFLVHYLRTSMMLESVPLQRATKLCPHIPVLVIAFSDNLVKARCCVPKEAATENFNAEKWLENVTKIFDSQAGAPKGQDPTLVCNMKAKKVSAQDWDALLSASLEAAKKYAKTNL